MFQVPRPAALSIAVCLGASACTPVLPPEVVNARVGPCDDFALDAEHVWNSEIEQRLRDALASFKTQFGKKALARVLSELGALNQRWARESRDACYATVIGKSMPKQQYVTLSACYDTALAQQRATVGRFLQPDLETVVHADEALYEVQRALDACGSVVASQAYVEDLAASDAAALGRAKTHLAEARSWLSTGHPAQAMDAATRAETDAERADVARVRAQASLEQGKALIAKARFRDAGARLEMALDMFFESRSPAGVADALVALSTVHLGVGELELAEQAAAEALTVRRSVLGPAHPEVGFALFALAEARRSQAHLRDALEDYRGTVSLWSDTLRSGHPFLVRAQSRMGAVSAELGEVDAGLKAQRDALCSAESELGRDHPEVAALHEAVARTLLMAGRNDAALSEARLALELREKVYGERHPEVAMTLQLMAQLFQKEKRYDEAFADLERSLEIRQKALGEQNRLVGETLQQQGELLMERHDPAAALEKFERALRIFTHALGADHPVVLSLGLRMGDALLATRRYADAQRTFDAARSAFEQRLGPTHPSVATARVGLGRADEGQHELAEALNQYRQALSLREAVLGEKNGSVADLQADLARVLLKQKELKSALAYAERALEGHSRNPGTPRVTLADDWATLGRIRLGLYQRQQGIDWLEKALDAYRSYEAPVDVVSETLRGTPKERAQGVLVELQKLGVPIRTPFG